MLYTERNIDCWWVQRGWYWHMLIMLIKVFVKAWNEQRGNGHLLHRLITVKMNRNHRHKWNVDNGRPLQRVFGHKTNHLWRHWAAQSTSYNPFMIERNAQWELEPSMWSHYLRWNVHGTRHSVGFLPHGFTNKTFRANMNSVKGKLQRLCIAFPTDRLRKVFRRHILHFPWFFCVFQASSISSSQWHHQGHFPQKNKLTGL